MRAPEVRSLVDIVMDRVEEHKNETECSGHYQKHGRYERLELQIVRDELTKGPRVSCVACKPYGATEEHPLDLRPALTVAFAKGDLGPDSYMETVAFRREPINILVPLAVEDKEIVFNKIETWVWRAEHMDLIVRRAIEVFNHERRGRLLWKD